MTASEVVVTAISMPKFSISQFHNRINCLSYLLCKYVCNGNPAADSCNNLDWLQDTESHNSESFILKCTTTWWLHFRETSYVSQLAAAATTLFQLFYHKKRKLFYCCEKISDFIITDKSCSGKGPQILSCVVDYKYSDIWHFLFFLVLKNNIRTFWRVGA